MRNIFVAALLLATTLALYLAGQRSNPPALHPDEASISYNALHLARYGTDEDGVRCALYFRTRGDWKNVPYIYLLAAIFRFVPPSDVVGRHLSAVVMWLAGVAMGWLAWNLTRRRWIAVATFFTTLATPMLYDISRNAFEVALYPLCIALFLVAVHAASRRERWNLGTVLLFVVMLVAATYIYSIGRLFAPLLATGLLFFAGAGRRLAIASICGLYLFAGVIPWIAFDLSHDGGLTRRLNAMGSFHRGRTIPDKIALVADYYADDLDLIELAVHGDEQPRFHVPRSGGSVLVMTLLLATIGATVAVAFRLGRFWMFLIWGVFASVAPVAFTYDVRHTLRMAPLPLFLIALSIPALGLLSSRRILLGAFFAAGAAQACFFFARTAVDGPKRPYEVGIRHIVEVALAQPQRPVFVLDDITRSLYCQCWWYAMLHNVDRHQFPVVTSPAVVPHGAVVISNAVPCDDCTRLASDHTCTLWRRR